MPSWAVNGGGATSGWEAEIDAVTIWQHVVTHFERLEKHLLDDVLVFANLIQIPGGHPDRRRRLARLPADTALDPELGGAGS